ncbi:MAG: TetR/AcrR family transcriptional regulator C-terminal domain-containing protein [Pseudomonadota bacterium]
MGKRNNLSAERIVERSIKMLDLEGHKKFSMRKLAASFGVDPMAIYYHIPSRAALMYKVVEHVVNQCELPQSHTLWQDDVKLICAGFRQLAHQHPGVIQVFDTFEEWVAGEHRIFEALYGALMHGGFDRKETARAARLLMAFTENFCDWELTDWISPFTPEMRTELDDSLSRGHFPNTLTLIEEITNVDPDQEFDYGLDVIIRGLESRRNYVKR